MADRTILFVDLGGDAFANVELSGGQLDISTGNVARLRDALRQLVAVPAEVKPKPPRAKRAAKAPQEEPGEEGGSGRAIRQWAAEHHFELAPYGRIPTEVRAAYQASLAAVNGAGGEHQEP